MSNYALRFGTTQKFGGAAQLVLPETAVAILVIMSVRLNLDLRQALRSSSMRRDLSAEPA